MSTDLKSKSESKTQKPKKYAVVFLNDDFTPMEFVIAVMVRIFGHDLISAEAITLDIHKKGKGVAGVFTHEIAETKAAAAMAWAHQNEFPLKADVQPEED
jgi:ATP-dependent Clp protease adaptor protein ClpS